MKKLFTLGLFIFTASFLFGQVACEPNPMYADSSAGVYPPSYHPDARPDGGISDTACVNEYFEFSFTVVVHETITIGPITQTLDSVVVVSMNNLPEGLKLDCNPESCVFPQNVFGCAVISGTPTDANLPEEYELTIETRIYTDVFPTGFDLNLPSSQIENPVGTFTLHLREEGYPNCLVGISETLSSQVSLKNVPNPANGLTQIRVSSDISGDFELSVIDLLGNEVFRQAIKVNEGENHFDFDGTHLSSGIYIYSIANDSGKLSKKMIINHR